MILTLRLDPERHDRPAWVPSITWPTCSTALRLRLQYLLPTIIFLVAVFLAFATGTSWGTFGILIPIV